MAKSSTDSGPDPIQPFEDGHFTKPDSPDGMGNTLGPDVSGDRQLAEDARIKQRGGDVKPAVDDAKS